MENENICEFCGQVLLDGRKCNCPEAKKAEEIERQILNAKAAINEIFVEPFFDEDIIPPSEQAIAFMKKSVEMIAYDNISKINIVLPGGVKAMISKKNKSIKVERTETIKSSQEV